MLGASADPEELNQKFTDKKLITALGIKAAAGYANRVTYIVDKDGKIAKIYTKVTPKAHADEVLKDVKQLSGK